MIDLENFRRAGIMFGTPLFLYEEKKLREQMNALKRSIDYTPKIILYAVKANFNPHILKILKEEGAGIDAVSPGEILLSLKVGFPPENILFTGNNITDDEMEYAVAKNVILNIDSLSQLEKFGRRYSGKKICVRINPDVGAGHHDHCITGGPKSKFGIWYSEAGKIKGISKKYGLKIVGIHHHIGSQILDPDKFLMAMDVLLEVASEFPELEFIDFGGGFGVPYKPEERPLNIQELGKRMSQRFREFCKEYGKELTLVIEPGRYLVAESGYLLVRVNTVKRNPDGRIFVGVNSGFNHLIRPAMYGSYHQIINISNLYSDRELVDIVGNLCESGDKISEEREIYKAREDDLLVIGNAGAYGYSMASNYNLRPKPAEVLAKLNGKLQLIRKRETLENITEG